VQVTEDLPDDGRAGDKGRHHHGINHEVHVYTTVKINPTQGNEAHAQVRASNGESIRPLSSGSGAKRGPHGRIIAAAVTRVGLYSSSIICGLNKVTRQDCNKIPGMSAIDRIR
jgi:hypothetical protein